MPTGTTDDDVFNAGRGRETFDGGAGTDTVSYAASSIGVDASLAAGWATLLPRVMPLGDSITHGMVSYADTESGGYRPKLWTLLDRDGLAIDYVGSQASGPSSLPDRDHQGMSGRTIDYVDRYDAGWLAAAAPDVVMLMIGTNDTARDSPARMIAELRALIVSITANQPEATLLVASIPPTHDAARQAKVEAYNAAIPGLIAELAPGRNLRFVDMGDLMRADVTAPPADNGLHPTDGGYAKIAANWHEALLATGLFENERDALAGIENLVGTAERDRLTGDDSVNQLSGLGGNDDLHGGDGADRLDGGAGADLLAGGDGGDLYLVDSSGDRVVEAVGGGADRVHATVSYALAAGSYVEALAFVGSGNATLTGNEAANRLEGGAGSDKLYGGAQNDTLLGGGSSDTLDGGLGDDVLHGGGGNDTYVVDRAGDGVSEANPVTGADDGGSDTVKASVSYALGSFLEHLTLTEAAAVRGTGNGAANRITGSAADNLLFGEGGNDSVYGAEGADAIEGGAGNDKLGGGADADVIRGGDGTDHLYGDAGDDTLRGDGGADRFVFNAAPLASNGSDRVEDFVGGYDRLLFEDAVFTGLQARDSSGRITAEQVHFGAQAAEADDRVLYERSTGQIFYDADGSGAGASVLMATLNAGQAVTANDFYIA